MAAPSLAETLQGKRVGLALSAGFFGFYAHAGMLAALEQAGLAPAAVSGSSAGAMIGAMFAAGVDAADVAGILRETRRDDFYYVDYSNAYCYDDDVEFPGYAVRCVSGDKIIVKSSVASKGAAETGL